MRRTWQWLGLTDPELPAKILSMCVQDADGCQIWQGTQHRGYGVIDVYVSFNKERGNSNQQRLKVHRLWYLWHNESVPEGLELAHSCHKKLCAVHSRPKTHQENISEPGTPSSAPYGGGFKCEHPRIPANTYKVPSTGFEKCYTCDRNRTRRSRGYPELTFEQAMTSRAAGRHNRWEKSET